MPLFGTALVFETQELNASLRAEGDQWGKRDFQILEEPDYSLVVNAYGGEMLLIKDPLPSALARRGQAASRLLGHLAVLLEAFSASPAARLSELDLLTAAERRQLLVEWNDTRADYPAGACLHTLFEEQVDRSPDAVAPGLPGRAARLPRAEPPRPNRLAHYLRSQGVGPEVRVGL